METGSVERVLRDLPGVLDCSVHDEGIAIVVHPEIDPRTMELRAQVALAEIGERRPLLVVGGMSSGFAEPPRAPARHRSRPFARRSPLSLVGFAVLVVALITVVPIAGGGGKGSSRLPTVAAPLALDAPSSGRLPVVDEPGIVAVAAAAVVGPVVPGVRVLADAVRSVSSSSSVRTTVAAPVAPVVLAPAADPPARNVTAADLGKAKAKAKANGKASGKPKATGGGGKAKAAKVHSQGSRGRR